MSAAADVLGLISDTHGLLRPRALAAMQGCDLILHAGDTGKPGILDRLRAIAPVVVVRGNIDLGAWAWELPLTAAIETRSARIYMLHDVKQLELDPAAAGFQIVVSGHSHQPGQSERAGVVYVNPGSAGPRRFRLPIVVARLDLRRRPWSVEFIEVGGS